MKRRDFFKLMGIASGAALASCNNNADKKIMPYLVPPEEGIIPGVPRYLVSTCMECPAHCGINIKIRDDKPVKLEGNHTHPVNNGALCMRGQASISRLYHPNRVRQPMIRSGEGLKPVSWPEAAAKFKEKLGETKGKKRNIYLSSRTSGRLSELIADFCKETGMERAKEVEAFHHGAVRKANDWVFGTADVPYYRVGTCDALVTVGADLLETYLSPVEWARQLTAARNDENFKWFHFEPGLGLTGTAADERRAVKPGSEYLLLSYLLWKTAAFHKQPVPDSVFSLIKEPDLNEVTEKTGLNETDIKTLQDMLEQAKRPLIISGGPSVGGPNGLLTAAYTSLLQWALGTTGGDWPGVDFSHAFNYGGVGTCLDMKTLADECENGKLGIVFFSRVVAGEGTAAAFKKAGFKVVLAETLDNPLTGFADMVLPLAHPLESWGEAKPRNGVLSVLQPAIEPLEQAKSEGDILLALLGRKTNFQALLADEWQGKAETWLTEGWEQPKVETKPVALAEAVLIKGLKELKPAEPAAGIHLLVTPSLRTFDGRGKDLALLNEIPDPVTAATYGKWLSISPDEAKSGGVSDGDVVKLECGALKAELPAVLIPGMPPGIIWAGIDALDGVILPVDELTGQRQSVIGGVTLSKSGERIKIPILAGTRATGKRSILPGYEAGHHHGHGDDNHGAEAPEKNGRGKAEKIPKTLYPPHEHKDYRWGMVIDLDRCMGCSACVAACYIENNIALVGEKEHLRGREMAWLRIEPYYNDPERPEFVPMMCQHCDHAPCETVCPVYATYHNPEGLNAQVYNRCVGTRYCANNCPYKARRFNWYDHEGQLPLYAESNPDLSVRPKGVMEKCTFCIQRIRFAKDVAKDEKRLVKDGEVIPACAQTCPAGAITFGNLMDPNSKVSQLAKTAGAYRIQELLGTEPAVYYIKNKKKKS